MGEALYRKYRSQSLDEIVGQEHITRTLKNAIDAGKISHAYLFTGPRGVGKTSIARILAYEINKLPYNSADASLDIIEIDAASNRRIDEVRDLRDKVHVAPARATYKVYIIDEVHMLTKEAFNALLKTLEEPPAHVVFILATTEAHKLPETIISRTQRFTFKPIDNQAALTHLKELAKQEKITISDEALQLIIEHSQGSFRDSISMLDQISSVSKDISIDDVRQVLGVPPLEAIEQTAQAVLSNDAQEVMKHLQHLYDQGYQTSLIAKGLAAYFRATFVQNQSVDKTLLHLTKQLLEVPLSHDPQTALELALLEATLQEGSHATTQPNPVEKKRHKVEPSKTPSHAEKPSTKPSTQTPKKSKPVDDTLWQETLQTLKGTYNTLYGIARMAEATVQSNTITLGFNFPFHYRRCNEPRNKQRIAEVASRIAGSDVAIECELQKTDTPKKTKPQTARASEKPSSSATLDSITEVFGGGEILD